jgi:hypothetical protein
LFGEALNLCYPNAPFIFNVFHGAFDMLLNIPIAQGEEKHMFASLYMLSDVFFNT